MTELSTKKWSTKIAYLLGVVGVIATLLTAGAVVYYWEFVRELGAYGYLGAFLISILGGVTIIIPVPMLAVVFAMGRVMEYTWLVGAVAGLGETLGAVTIYMTGYGGGTAFHNSTHRRVQAIYGQLMRLMERKGSLTLFLLAAVLNPFFYPAALAAGALRFGLKRYFLICWAGKTIKGMTVAYVGYWGLRGLIRILGAPT
ncbi:MAG: hypothetical protein CL874_03775 [Dehalococcoidales bacterium]|jgi:membrane protein YqaA with SNARE-associated domain|nr:hypothetical protein [Dehalococcoidales bacterium]MDP6576670.1 VTT domain-containing protein [Dehalococcoidales bacterium]